VFFWVVTFCISGEYGRDTFLRNVHDQLQDHEGITPQKTTISIFKVLRNQVYVTIDDASIFVKRVLR
jgi:hypothetical protein